MCVIATHPAGRPLTKIHTARMWRSNRDGAGFSYVNENGRVVVRKGFMKYGDFDKAYNNAVEKNPDSPFVVHFRIRTHGRTDEERTHPFYIGKDASVPRPALAHNGYVGCVPDHPIKSDTQMLVEMYPEIFATKEALRAAIDKGVQRHLGYSKFAVMFPDKEIIYINKNAGSEDSEGRWYSNQSWDTKAYTPIDGVVVEDNGGSFLGARAGGYRGYTGDY